jgi:hypothetical protein
VTCVLHVFRRRVLKLLCAAHSVALVPE